MKKTAAVAAASLALSASALIATATPASAAGWFTMDRASTGSTRWVSVYSGNGCTGSRKTLREGQALNGNSIRTHWFGWGTSHGRKYRIYGDRCFTPIEANFPFSILLNGPKA